MSRETFVLRDGKLVPKHLAPPKNSDLKRNGGIITDIMQVTWHPCDNKYYDSKSKFRAATRAHGAVEVGTDKVSPRKPEPDRTIKSDIARTIAELGG